MARKRLPEILLTCITMLIGFTSMVFAESTPAEQTDNPLFDTAPTYKLSVVRVIDDDFPDISDSDMTAILKIARTTYGDKFGLSNIEFIDKGKVGIESFFEQNLDRKNVRVQRLEANRYKPGKVNDFSKHIADIERFLNKSYKIEELDRLLPEAERNKIKTMEAFVPILTKQMQTKLESIAKTEQNGKKLLRPEKADYRSGNMWFAVMLTQNKYDIILTNTLIVLDNMPMPVPHSVFGKCIIGGFSAESPAREPLGQKALMGSSFPLDTPLSQFWLPGHKPLQPAERNEVLGAYTLAHELGHAILNMADLYAVDDKCLMNNRKDISWKQSYDLMVAQPGPCAAEEPWRVARDLYWDAEAAYSAKNWDRAIALYTDVIRKTPKQLDQSWHKYIAGVCYKMSKAYLAMNQPDNALKGALKAKVLWRFDETYTRWYDELKAKVDAGKAATTP